MRRFFTFSASALRLPSSAPTTLCVRAFTDRSLPLLAPSKARAPAAPKAATKTKPPKKTTAAVAVVSEPRSTLSIAAPTSPASYDGPAKMLTSPAYSQVLKDKPIPRSLNERERRIVVNELKHMNLLEYHKGIAGGLLAAGSLTGPQHITPTSIVMAWWRCPKCDHKHRKRVFDHVVAADGQCPSCHHKPTVDDVYSEQTGKILMRAGRENVFAQRRTGATQQDVPFLANSNRRYSPMLAGGWDDHKRTYSSKTIMVSNKLDGIRCIAAYDPSTDAIHFFTRTGTMLESCDHLKKALAPLFKHDNGLVLDGELYAHKTFKDFQEVFSAVRTTKEYLTPEVAEIQNKLQYHIFDAMYHTSSISGLEENAGYADRVAYLKKMVPKLAGQSDRLLVVDGVPMAVEEADKALDDALAAGYEGIMIRHPDGKYEHGKRSTSLLKHKKMYDQEYEIVHCVEGKGKFTGMVGSFICKGPNGKNFAANPAVTEAMRKEMWGRRHEYIGQMGTVQYQELTRDEIPRFPVLKCVRGAKNGSNWL